jgi:hypothetical protein
MCQMTAFPRFPGSALFRSQPPECEERFVVAGIAEPAQQLTIGANALQYKLLPSPSRKFNAAIDLRLQRPATSASYDG